MIQLKIKQALKDKENLRGIYVVYKQLGMRALKSGKIELAVKNFEFVLRNFPNNVEIMLILSDLNKLRK